MRAKAPLADQGELSRASPASTRLRGSELSYFDNPSVKNQRFLPAPFTQGSRGCSRTSTVFDSSRNVSGIATPVLRHWFAMTTFYFGVHNDMRDTNRHQKMQNALRRKAGGRMGYEIQGFPTGMSVFSRMAWSRASRFSSWVKRKAFCLPSQQTTR